MIWRDSVGVGVLRSGLRSECAGYFSAEPLCLLRHTDELHTIIAKLAAVYGYNPALFWILSVSC